MDEPVRVGLQAAWRGLWGGERILLFFAALSALCMVLGRPIAFLANDDLEALLSSPVIPWTVAPPFPGRLEPPVDGIVHPELLDPRGQPWRFARGKQSFYEHGTRICFRVLAAGADRPTVDCSGRPSWEVPLLLAARHVGLGVTVVLLWLWAMVRAWFAPRSPWLPLEAWRVSIAASGPIALGVLFALKNARELSSLELLAAQRILVSPPVAAAATVSLILWLSVFGLRLRQKVEDVEAPIAWCRPAIVAGILTALAGLMLLVEWREQVSARRRDLLASASVGIPDSVSRLIASGDLELLRAFARRDSPWVDVALLTAGERAALAAVGPDDGPLLARGR